MRRILIILIAVSGVSFLHCAEINRGLSGPGPDTSIEAENSILTYDAASRKAKIAALRFPHAGKFLGIGIFMFSLGAVTACSLLPVLFLAGLLLEPLYAAGVAIMAGGIPFFVSGVSLGLINRGYQTKGLMIAGIIKMTLSIPMIVVPFPTSQVLLLLSLSAGGFILGLIGLPFIIIGAVHLKKGTNRPQSGSPPGETASPGKPGFTISLFSIPL